MKSPYRFSSVTMSRASGAGAYSHSVRAGTGAWRLLDRRAISRS